MDHNKDTTTINEPTVSDNSQGFYPYALAKIEKLNSALYAVTNFLSDSEPVKWRVRQLSVDLVTEMSSLSYRHDFYKTSLGLKLGPSLRSILKLLDTISATGIVSEMNIALLRQEYGRLIVAFEQESVTTFKRQIEQTLPPPASQAPSRPVGNPAFSPTRHNLPSAPSLKADRPDTPIFTGSSRSSRVGHNIENGSDEAKSSRQTQILAYLNGRSWTSIKDVAAQIKGCSRKTVQRDLAELVEQGFLEKQGERRWSRYRPVSKV